MKITLLLLFCSLVNLVASTSYSQNTKISLSLTNATIEEVLNKIEDESEFYFLFNQKLVNVQQKVDIEVDNESIKNILDEILSKDIKYVVSDRQIILTPKTIIVKNDLPQQQKEIKGIITDESGSPLPGVNIMIEGTTIGVLSNANGEYSISIPNDDVILIFSFIGFQSQKVSTNGRSTVSPKLISSNTLLDEVVVTALGIKREAKSLGYSATSFDTKQFTTASTINVGNSLSGKVAGLNVSTPPTGPGGSSKIRIRGQSSFGGNNSPLIVVNGVPINNTPNVGSLNVDYGDGLQSINPDDIESMTVLKGASAAALYGFRAKDGVIIITSKSGRGQTGIGVEINSSFLAEEALDFTDFQYEYGQGEYGIRPASIADARSSGTWSYGTKFDGLPVWNADGLEHPYVPFKDRIKAFYNTGITLTNEVAISGANEKGDFRLSFANTNANGIIPNTNFHKNIMNLGLSHKLSKKLSTELNANYSIENNENPPAVGGQAFNVNNTLYTMANSIDPRWLKTAYKYPVTGDEIGISRFVPRTNMYWTINERQEDRKRNRLFGNVLLRYQFAPWLYAQGRLGQDYFTVDHSVNSPTGTRSLSPVVSGFNGDFYQASEQFNETNLDFLIGVNKKIGVFGIDANLGGNSMNQIRQNLSTKVTNFYEKGLYTIGNGQIKDPQFSYYRKKVNSLYGTVDFSFKDYLYLNLTARNDWFSTLNPESNSYLYPSVSSGFLFSQAFPNSMPSWLNYGKIRAAYAEVGGDTEPYTNKLYYSLNSNPFNNVALGNIKGAICPNEFLRPLKVKEAEAGIELILFERRISFDFAAYRKNTVDEILDVDISNASGFGSTKVNVGKLRNQGIEALLTIVPLRNQNFSWESAFNYTYNESLVLELAGGQQKIDVGTGDFIGIVSHEVGMPMGSLRGVDYKRDAQGRIITSNGRFLAGDLITYGSAIPKHTGGWINTFNYKIFRVFAQIDFKAGHKMISNTNFNFQRSGLNKASLEGREGGVVIDGYNSDGSPNTIGVEVESFNLDYGAKKVAFPFVYDAGFIRWRTLSAGADLSRLFNKTFIKGLNINASINNFLMIKKYVPNIDPETVYSVSDNMAGIESGSLPTTRSYALNISLKF